MIAEKQLAIVRAALSYFRDEFEPHGDSFESCLDSKSMTLGIRNSDIGETCKLFAKVVARHVLYDTDSDQLTTTQHFACEDTAKLPTPVKRIRYVTLLLPNEKDG